MTEIYDVIIIGGGPGGAAAGVYAARKKLKTLLITESFGGQSLVAASIENWIGTKKISGYELAKSLEEHVRAQEGIEIKMPERVVEVKKMINSFEVKTDKNNIYYGKTLIALTGGRRRRLNVPGEEKFISRGVSYCSTCDAPLFRGKTVAVIGGGNSGLEAVIDLSSYASKIYLINLNSVLRGDPLTQEKVKELEKVEIFNHSQVKEILGEKAVEKIKLENVQTKEIKELEIQGVFVEIGSQPNSEFLKGLVEMNEVGEIIIDHKTAATSHPGIFAAGDVTDEIYKQNNISAGDAVKAALSAYNYLMEIDKKSPALN